MAKLIKLALQDVVLDPRLDLRVSRSKDVIEAYKAQYDTLDKPKVFRVKDQWLLVDGWHRFYAAQRLHLKDEYFQNCGSGAIEKAWAIAWKSNRAHGVPLTRADKVKFVHRVHENQIKTDPKWTMNHTARLLEMKETTVQLYFRRPNGRYSEPVDNVYGSKPGMRNRYVRKSELDAILDQVYGLISSGAGKLVKVRLNYPLETWSQDQKDRLFQIALRFEKALPPELFINNGNGNGKKEEVLMGRLP